ncbi:MAG: Asp-tRNA(Asn)/Glu-tRNA(Gln) amidotransferase subunit GatA [Planctomycetota bacterium]|nr:Asp-tRNA(Asn)/Glu-tRNA(Gln) amidotransferase subunit GatA [Planctomycetota bacterium]
MSDSASHSSGLLASFRVSGIPCSAHEVAGMVASRRLGPLEAARASLERLRAVEPALDAFLSVASLDATSTSAISPGEPSSTLAGVPIAIKDNICTLESPTTCASRMLENYRSPFEATAVAKLRARGAIVVGKTNLDEFGMGSSTEHSAFKPTRNPWDLARVPGGSSGGSAAAVASGIVPIALGSDTGGSVRQPASFCGVVGLKPTYGRVSRHGLVAYASSLDQIGVLASTVRDASVVLEALCGEDPLDATSSSLPPPELLESIDEPVDGLRLAVPAQARSGANHPEITRVMNETISALQHAGATIVDVDLPMLDESVAAYYVVAMAEASSNLARFDGVRYGRRAERPVDLMDLYCRSRSEGLGAEVKRRILLGTHVLSAGYYDAYYATALKVRRLIKNAFDFCFATTGAACHALLMPVAPTPAFKLGEKQTDSMAMYLEDVYTVPVNLAGLPAISVPAGLGRVADAAGPLPVGMQLIGRAFDEATLVRVARMLELACAAACSPR